MAARGLGVVTGIVVLIGLDVTAHAACGDRSGDDAAVAAAARTAVAACACDGGARRPRCLHAAIRRVRAADGLRAACRHDVFLAARAAACAVTSTSTSTSTTTSTQAPTLTGRWRLTGEIVDAGCNVAPGIESELMITQDGSNLTATSASQPYSGTVRSVDWQLNNVYVQLGSCPTGQIAETFWRIAGTLPDADGIVTVEQTIEWSSPIAPYFPCPECTVRWQGTMTRE